MFDYNSDNEKTINVNYNINNAITAEKDESSYSSLFKNIKYFPTVIVHWFITGIGGYHNTWKPLEKSSTLYWYRSNLYLNYGCNGAHIFRLLTVI